MSTSWGVFSYSKPYTGMVVLNVRIVFLTLQATVNIHDLIHVDCVLGQWNIIDHLPDSVITGLTDETERHTIWSIHTRSLCNILCY